MDQGTRSELDKLHERITHLRERVVNLEAQQPHINAALLRIEGSVEKLVNKISKAIWVVATPLIAILVGVLLKSLMSGHFAGL
jgi:hypothetical protein